MLKKNDVEKILIPPRREETVLRTFEKDGFIICVNYNKKQWQRTTYYALLALLNKRRAE